MSARRIDDLRNSCLSNLDELEAIIFLLKDEAHLRFLRNNLTTLVDDYVVIIADSSKH